MADSAAESTGPTLWEDDGLQRVLARIDDGAHIIEELSKFVQERAALQKKFARELAKFGKKWEERVVKLPGPPDSTAKLAWAAASKEASDVAAVNELVEQSLDGLQVKVARWRKEHYVKSLGKLVVKKDVDKSFQKLRKPLNKAGDVVRKAMSAYHNKCKDVEKLEQAMAAARQIDHQSTEAECKKLQAKLDKAMKDRDKAKLAYEDKLKAHDAARLNYEKATRAEFEACQEREKTRLRFASESLAAYARQVNMAGLSEYSAAQSSVNTGVAGFDADKDVAAFAAAMALTAPSPSLAFAEWSGSRAGTPVPAEAAGKQPGEWFVKAGEKKKSRSHRRFFLLKGSDLEYFAGYKKGLPIKQKGTIQLKYISEVQQTGPHISLLTAERHWMLTASEEEVAERWAGLICGATGKGLTPVPIPVVSATAAAAVMDLPKAGEDFEADEAEEGEEAEAAGSAADDAAPAEAAAAGAAVAAAAGAAEEGKEELPDISTFTEADHEAATKIQARYRGFAARKANADGGEAEGGGDKAEGAAAVDAHESAAEVEAATKIQAHYRGFKARKELNAPEADKEAPAAVDATEEETHAATLIQANFRGHQQRKADKAENEAATKLQANFRGFQARKQLKQGADGTGAKE